MIGAFWFYGAFGRATMGRCMPLTWACMYRAALWRHRVVFGNPHTRAVRAFYYGR